MEIKACQVGLRVKYYDHEKNVWSTGKIVEQPEGQKVKVQPEKGGDTVTIMARNIRPAPAYNGVVITIDRSSVVSLEMNERGIQIKLDNSSSYDRGFVHSLNATVLPVYDESLGLEKQKSPQTKGLYVNVETGELSLSRADPI
jgi:hypothetical protein